MLEITCQSRRLEKTSKRSGEPVFPSKLLKPMPDGADFAVWEEERAELKYQWEEEWRTYKTECQLLDDLRRDLVDARRDEADAKLHLGMAEAAQARHIAELLRTAEHARTQEQMCDLRIQVMELQLEKAGATERVANAPMRAKVAADATRVWGGDHTSRPPAAVYDLRGPLQPVPPPEQHANGSWIGARIGGRIPVVTAKQA